MEIEILRDGYFNPLSPCGERLASTIKPSIYKKFQSTLPMRGETCACQRINAVMISFQSTLPMRGETATLLLGLKL